ncbi:AlpA family transcriptional regulator [Brachybacterium sp. ACRRE]|uniref:helix-turn-helix transcriptional regulator n=1 Tax=Brachybacterium sp. ACRRE TaxID=2918184 RepID=UPI001EF3809F|nr:helix-turn-helix domain-containing protein [Brachybacterium sp. ACRRE]MCG7308271.1 helix-turn-helix domain-containing protein [Brachybacterium sp. ACRRE]
MARKNPAPDVITMDELLTAGDVAEALGLSVGTLANWRSLELGPKYIKVGGRVRYRVSSVNTWVAEQEHKIA